VNAGMAEDEEISFKPAIEAAQRIWEQLDPDVKAAYDEWAKAIGYRNGFEYFLGQSFGVWVDPEKS
jgi:hypothetical protein